MKNPAALGERRAQDSMMAKCCTILIKTASQTNSENFPCYARTRAKRL